jgi:hypothetical protein
MRRTTIIALCAALAATAPGAAAASAQSSSAAAVIADCQRHNKLTGSYTTQALRRALATLPADVAEYTDCHDVIQSAIFAQANGPAPGGSGGGSSGSSFLPTPVIVILVVLALGGITFMALEIRRRRGGQQ